MLAKMISVDEAALRCDLMETYGILNYRALPARQISVFACGLRESSRIMRKLSGAPAPFSDMMLAVIADAVRILVWQNTKDGVSGRNAPTSIFATLLDKGGSTFAFDSTEDFDAWRESILNGE